MHIVIYGTGGVGGYFGSRLAQAGNKVTFIARGKHLQAIQQNGLQLKSYKGNYTVFPADATDDITQISEKIDLVLIAVKTWQLPKVATHIKKVLFDETMVISLQNGVTNQDILSDILGKERVLGGLCTIVSKIEESGIITHISYEPTIVFGELDNKKTERALLLKQKFEEANIKTILADDIQVAIWTKFLYISTVSAIGALTRSTIGEMIAVPEIKEIMLQTAYEIVEVAKVKGVLLPSDIVQKQFKIIENQPYDTTSSLQRDIMGGKPSELEAQNGAIVKMGKKWNVPTPINHFIYYSLIVQEQKHRKKKELL